MATDREQAVSDAYRELARQATVEVDTRQDPDAQAERLAAFLGLDPEAIQVDRRDRTVAVPAALLADVLDAAERT